ncbi:hypothetical protein NQ317_000697 [Molorchus minor]|uniref:Transcription factor CBF/NF-Y/archaeal histone domain-containing protein n=1 Tax=Molorchus minor TaxID=1323400 RepID=A0ABQ9JBV1_9CUCU|nr:hypothetical protein NQ317_000697 [Molorchus minor]
MEEIEVNVSSPANEEHEVQTTEAAANEALKHHPNKHRPLRLPLSRIRSIMKKDPSCNLINQDAVFDVTKATELFIEFLAKEAAKQLKAAKRKTMMRKDIDNAIKNCPTLCF